jgi:hypothetical protein
MNIAWAYDYSFPNHGSGYTTIVYLYFDVISSANNGGTITSYSDDVNIGNPS